jgi:hypothetical protein
LKGAAKQQAAESRRLAYLAQASHIGFDRPRHGRNITVGALISQM